MSMMGFHEWCRRLPSVVRAIDGTYFSITKPNVAPEEYYYSKKGGYSMHCQDVVDKNIKFIQIYVGMLKSVIDSRA